MEVYSAHNEEKSVVTERFIRILKNEIKKHMTSVSKNVYIDKLNDIVDEYNKTYKTIKMKPINAKTSAYIDFYVKNNNKDSKFKVFNFEINITILKYCKRLDSKLDRRRFWY